MRGNLAELRATLQELKRASVFKKVLAAEAALMAALVLIEEMVEEIEKLQRGKVARTDKAIVKHRSTPHSTEAASQRTFARRPSIRPR